MIRHAVRQINLIGLPYRLTKKWNWQFNCSFMSRPNSIADKELPLTLYPFQKYHCSFQGKQYVWRKNVYLPNFGVRISQKSRGKEIFSNGHVDNSFSI